MIEEFETDDGSLTFYNADVGEHYHSKTGAFLEAQEKYAVACKVKERAKKGSLVFFDVCFGLGYNTYFGIKAALQENPHCEIVVHCFENDKEILRKILGLPIEDETFQTIKRFIHQFFEEEKEVTIYSEPRITCIMYYGDVMKTIDKVKDQQENKSADCVFFDPFSPKKMPMLWSEEMFSKVYDNMATGSVLATYSCARIVRDNMKTVGLRVVDGPIVGRWCPCTLAYKD